MHSKYTFGSAFCKPKHHGFASRNRAGLSFDGGPTLLHETWVLILCTDVRIDLRIA